MRGMHGQERGARRVVTAAMVRGMVVVAAMTVWACGNGGSGGRGGNLAAGGCDSGGAESQTLGRYSDTSRKITLRSHCSQELWIGAAGNNFTPTCTTDADCGIGTCVAGVCTAVSCGSHADCGSPNTFCGGVESNLPASQATCKVGAGQCPKDTSCNANARVYLTPTVACSASNPCAGADETCDTVRGACYYNLCGYQTCYYVPVPVLESDLDCTPCATNADCDGDTFCFVANGSADDTGKPGWCSAVPSTGNYWDLPPNTAPVEVNIPNPWAGRFWARTGCTDGMGGFTCDTGQCTDDQGNPTKYCIGSATGAPTLAEFSFAPFKKEPDGGIEASDFYDLSLVDGGNVQLQIAPDVTTYDLTTQNATKAGIPSGEGACTNEDQRADLCSEDLTTATTYCEQKFGWGWVCDGTACVNKFQCGSPGCLDGTCGDFGFGKYVCPSTWDPTIDFALSEAACPDGLEHTNALGAYVGCFTPNEACQQTNPPAALDCTSNENLYGCAGDYATSCYNAPTAGTCCGCPSWTRADLCQGGTNTTWTTDVETPYLDAFHRVAPQAYAFAYDDKASTFTCIGQSAERNVSYTLDFCPRPLPTGTGPTPAGTPAPTATPTPVPA